MQFKTAYELRHQLMKQGSKAGFFYVGERPLDETGHSVAFIFVPELSGARYYTLNIQAADIHNFSGHIREYVDLQIRNLKTAHQKVLANPPAAAATLN